VTVFFDYRQMEAADAMTISVLSESAVLNALQRPFLRF
jgi:hypothetical protein